VHGNVYRSFFVPKPLPIVLNFIALGSICLQVYVLQLVVHFITTAGEETAAASIYVGVFSLTFASVALLTGVCLRYRWSELDRERRRKGVRGAIALGGIAAGMAIGTVLAVTLAGSLTFWNPLERVLLFLLGCTAAGTVVGTTAAKAVARRIA
jgi:hypothetical protein